MLMLLYFYELCLGVTFIHRNLGGLKSSRYQWQHLKYHFVNYSQCSIQEKSGHWEKWDFIKQKTGKWTAAVSWFVQRLHNKHVYFRRRLQKKKKSEIWVSVSIIVNSDILFLFLTLKFKNFCEIMDRKGSLERYHPPRRADDDLSNAFENMRVDDGYHNVGRGRGSHRWEDMVNEVEEGVSLVEEDIEEEGGVGIEITMMDTSMSTIVGDTLPIIMTITGSFNFAKLWQCFQ